MFTTLDPRTGYTTLDQHQINLIKQNIAFKTGRFDFDITDQEVFQEVENQLEEQWLKMTGEDEYPTFQEAAESSYDDWGCYNATISETRYAQKGNTFLTFPTI